MSIRVIMEWLRENRILILAVLEIGAVFLVLFLGVFLVLFLGVSFAFSSFVVSALSTQEAIFYGCSLIATAIVISGR